jgi:two-component system, chemotaxis family, response regulator Rcp1
MKNAPTDLLLVEDNAADVRLITKRLRARGMEGRIHTVADGESALDFLHAAKGAQKPCPQLIVLDINLPRLSGREVLRYIKADAALHVIPVIVFTTTSNPAEVLDFYYSSANAFIVKPFDIDEYFKACDIMYDFWMSVVSLPRLQLKN